MGVWVSQYVSCLISDYPTIHLMIFDLIDLIGCELLDHKCTQII